jgi:hypothetical protein
LAVGLNPIQILLFAVELTLLAATLIVVILGRREAKGREALITEMGKTARIVSREEYFNNVLEGLQGASDYVFGRITGTSRGGARTDYVDKVLKQIQLAASRGVDVRYIIPRTSSRLNLGYRYVKAGAKIRFDPDLLVSDIRYMIIDRDLVVLGLPEKAGEREPTRSGYKIPSEGLATLLKTDFMKHWNSPESRDYDEYLLRILNSIRKESPETSDQLIATQLSVDLEEIRRLKNSSQTREKK